MTRRNTMLMLGLSAAMLSGCARKSSDTPDNEVAWGTAKPLPRGTVMQSSSASPAPVAAAATQPIGFDRNDYPGDATMAAMRSSFTFTGYWLTPPPGATVNTWSRKRSLLREQGWGFLLLANGELDKDILAAKKSGTSPADMGRKDAATAIAAARNDEFPAGAILFLDQEEGGRLLEEQGQYLLAWTEAVAASEYKPGLYASGQPVKEGTGDITTIRDVRERIKAGHLHNVAMFDAQDACPPAPGCTMTPKPLSAAGEPNLVAWQYAQSPRRPDITKSCAKTYAADGNCYAPGFGTQYVDLNLASSTDPSNGR